MKKAPNPFKFVRITYEYMGGRAKAMYDKYVDLTRSTGNDPNKPLTAEQIARLTAGYVLESMSEAGLYGLNKMEEQREEVKKPDPIPSWAKGWAKEPDPETSEDVLRAAFQEMSRDLDALRREEDYEDNRLGSMDNGTRILWGPRREGAPNWNVWRVMRCLNTTGHALKDHIALAAEEKPYVKFLHKDTLVRRAPVEGYKPKDWNAMDGWGG